MSQGENLMNGSKGIVTALVLLGLLLSACSAALPTELPAATEPPDQPTDSAAQASDLTQQDADIEYTLLTGGDSGGLVFVGVGGEIDGQVNPTLTAEPGDLVRITLINGDAIQHNLAIDEFGVKTADVTQLEAETVVIFRADQEGEYVYYCAIPGHRQAGMFGTFKVGEAVQERAVGEDIVRNPADLPGPVGDRGPETVEVNLTAQEVVGQLADGTTFNYFTFNGQVPGPMIRVRVGDTVQLSLSNDTSSTLAHSIDLHAVNGPGGGAVYTETAPGSTTSFTFQTLNPGVYVYHCATPSVAMHIANGMYGLIVVEPEGGLPQVDREFYVMQGEIYTEEDFGTAGEGTFSHERMLDEDPEYFVFNGAAAALTTEEKAMQAEVGETVRIFFGVGGPNFISSFHVIGEIFDRVYNLASVTTPVMTDVQTTIVPPGGATVVEFELEVPGRYILVDHALSRLERGLAGFLFAEGPDNPEVFREGVSE